MLQLTTLRKQETPWQTPLTIQARGFQQGKPLLLQHRGPSKTLLDPVVPSETLHLIAYNEWLFQREDYVGFFYYFEKRDEDSYQPVNLLLS